MAANLIVLVAILACSSCLAAPQQRGFGSNSGFRSNSDSQFDDGLFQQSFTTTSTQGPIAKIVKQINKHNQDGSYTFGYESQDGSFRVETRGVDGITRGKYGYMDQNGKLQEIEYLAGTETGYEPSGAGIQVPPRPPKRQKGTFDYDYEDYDDQGNPIRRRPTASRPPPAPRVPQHKPVRQPQQTQQHVQPAQQHVQPVQQQAPVQHHQPVQRHQSSPVTQQQLLAQFPGVQNDPFPAHTSRGRSKSQRQPQFESQFEPQQQSFQPQQQSFQPQQQSFQPQQQSFQPQQQSFQPQQQSFHDNDPISAFLGRHQGRQQQFK